MANINFSFGIQMDKSSVKQTQDEIKKIIQYFQREMATSPNSQLKIKTEGKGDANTIVNSGSGTPMFNAYIRSKKLMTTLRERIKFKGYLKT